MTIAAAQALAIASPNPARPEPSAASLVHALETAAPTDLGPIHELLVPSQNPAAVRHALLARLNAADNQPTLEARNRFWRVLTDRRFDTQSPKITDPAVVDQFAAAITLGDVSTRVQVAQEVRRIDPPLRRRLAEPLRVALMTEEHAQALGVIIRAASIADALSGPALAYAERIAQDLSNAPIDMHAELFFKDEHGEPTTLPTARGISLRTTAITAVMRSKPTVLEAVQYARSFPDTDAAVAPAMFPALGDNPSVADAPATHIDAWITEYTRRFCLDANKNFRKKWAMSPYLFIYEQYPDSRAAFCAAIDHIIATLNDDFRGYQAAVAMRGFCNQG